MSPSTPRAIKNSEMYTKNEKKWAIKWPSIKPQVTYHSVVSKFKNVQTKNEVKTEIDSLHCRGIV